MFITSGRVWVNEGDHGGQPSAADDVFRSAFVYTLSMLFMVIERFKNGDPRPVGERFRVCGRMLPEGVTYQASWIEKDESRCFQIMEAPSLAALNVWVSRWDDLVDFDITPVMTSADFWAQVAW